MSEFFKYANIFKKIHVAILFRHQYVYAHKDENRTEIHFSMISWATFTNMV